MTSDDKMTSCYLLFSRAVLLSLRVGLQLLAVPENHNMILIFVTCVLRLLQNDCS